MASAKECRENAHECLGWAMTAKSDNEREIFLEMARSWKKAAIQSAADPRLAAGGSLGRAPRNIVP